MTNYPPEIEAYVQEKIDSGQFRSRDELAIAAVRVYREIEAARAQLKSDIQAAIDEAKQGLSEPLDIEAIQSELVNELDPQGRPK